MISCFSNFACFGVNRKLWHYIQAAMDGAIITAPNTLVPVASGFPCKVYACNLGTLETTESSLVMFEDSAGVKFARLRCFKLLDNFDESGCRQWDRLELNKVGRCRLTPG